MGSYYFDQGSPGCEYCRISKDDVETTLDLTSAGLFAGSMGKLKTHLMKCYKIL